MRRGESNQREGNGGAAALLITSSAIAAVWVAFVALYLPAMRSSVVAAWQARQSGMAEDYQAAVERWVSEGLWDSAILALGQNNLANHVEVVRDGAEALEFIFGTNRYANRSLHNGPRVILLDLKLPLVDGLEVLRRVKADPRTRAIPIVVLTSSREEPDMAEAYRLGVNSYIVKPVDFGQFTEAVRSIGLYWLLLNEAPAAPAGA